MEIIDGGIEQMVRSCRQCQVKQNDLAKDLAHHPIDLQELIHEDFASPVDGHRYFIVVGAFSEWVQSVLSMNAITEWCIKELRKMCANLVFLCSQCLLMIANLLLLTSVNSSEAN